MARATKKFFEELRKEIMEGKTAQPDNAPTQAVSKEGEEYMKRLPYEMCESLMITIQNRNDEIARLSEENEKLKAENERMLKEWETFRDDKEKVIKEAQTDAIRELVEQIIAYAEDFPSNQNDKAEVIKEVLMGKLVNAHIPPQAMTEDLHTRLFNLGRKEANLNLSVNSQNTQISNSHIRSFYEGTE